MMALNFFRTLMARSPCLSAAVPHRLNPRLRRGGALLPVRDVARVLERQSDIVKALEKPRAFGGRNLECDIGSAGPGNALCVEVGGKRSRAIGGNDARDESFRRVRLEHDGQHAVLQAVLAIN